MNARVKICGLTNAADAILAADLGAAYLGFIFFPKSPRFLSMETYRQLRDNTAGVSRVYVQVCPEVDELRAAVQEGFDFFQLHFRPDETADAARVDSWTEILGPERLWLAPRIAPGAAFPERFLNNAETFLIDTYSETRYGGTGETGDWGRFRQWAHAMPAKRWILSGGLKPENIGKALKETAARIVDASSGLEVSPGKKDPEKMRAFFREVNSRDRKLSERCKQE